MRHLQRVIGHRRRRLLTGGACLALVAMLVTVGPFRHADVPRNQPAHQAPQGTVAQGTVAQAASPALSGVVGYLTIPRLHVWHVPIADRGLDAAHQMVIAPGSAVTHYALSASLGSNSNAVLYGHDDTDGSVFADLGSLRAGDPIMVQTLSGMRLVYDVVGNRIVAPRAITILDATSTPTLTLFTCYPLHVDTERVVVTATPAPASA
jgi:LPXTG-site transpeptidase (sortase) family protein